MARSSWLRSLFSDVISVDNDKGIVIPTTSSSPGASLTPATDGSLGFADYSVGENVVVFRYNTPKGFDKTTGEPILTYNDSYTGFYSIDTVVHTFEDRFFFQQLSGKRIPGSNVSTVLSQSRMAFTHTSITTTSEATGEQIANSVTNRISTKNSG